MLNNLINDTSKSKLNWLRAAVLGANDGIVSIAGLVVGVAGATSDTNVIATAGIAGLVAGALSMAAGEYISVSTQRDAEKAYIANEKKELKEHPTEQLQELTNVYKSKGLSTVTATKVAKELTAKDALQAHLEVEFGLDEDDLTNPWHAAYASAISFTFGGLIPVIAILATPQSVRIGITFISVLIALALTGYLSAKIGNAPVRRATIRVVMGGLAAMIITYGIGVLFGVSVA
ncbi:MAG: VIT family protein [Candidatus Saccharimonadales bacterium]